MTLHVYRCALGVPPAQCILSACALGSSALGPARPWPSGAGSTARPLAYCATTPRSNTQAPRRGLCSSQGNQASGKNTKGSGQSMATAPPQTKETEQPAVSGFRVCRHTAVLNANTRQNQRIDQSTTEQNRAPPSYTFKRTSRPEQGTITWIEPFTCTQQILTGNRIRQNRAQSRRKNRTLYTVGSTHTYGQTTFGRVLSQSDVPNRGVV